MDTLQPLGPDWQEGYHLPIVLEEQHPAPPPSPLSPLRIVAPDEVSATSAEIPCIQLPQDDRPDNEFALELGRILSARLIYCHFGHAVEVVRNDDVRVLRQIEPEEFCTLIQR
jgi:hypothetical protein